MNHFTQLHENAAIKLKKNMPWLKKWVPKLVLAATLIFAVTLLVMWLLKEPTKDTFVNQLEHYTQPISNASTAESFESIRVGNNSYKVHEDLDNPKFAAETMDALNQVAQQLISLLNNKYINNEQGIDSIKPQYRDIVRKGIISLKKNFKTANMEENIPERSGGDTSYVIDKGDVFAMCLRDPKNNNIVDVSNNMNELKFVLIHEMAHLFTSTFGHDSLFWNNFKFMLEEATIAGIYTPINYKKNKKPYCGIVISYSPIYDADLKEYVDRTADKKLIQDKFLIQSN
jgi:predicted metal-dependent hydrolase